VASGEATNTNSIVFGNLIAKIKVAGIEMYIELT